MYYIFLVPSPANSKIVRQRKNGLPRILIKNRKG